MRPDHKTYIGGSDAGPLMGVGYKSPLDVFYLKTGKTEPDDLSDNEAVRWGTALEPFVLKEAERLLGLPVVSHPFKRIQNRLHKNKDPYLGGHVDGLVYTANGVHVVEAKTSMYRRFRDGLPADIEWQVRHYMALFEAPVAHVIVAVLDRREFLRFDVQRDGGKEADMLVAYLDFWDRVTEARPPQATRSEDEQYFNLEGEAEANPEELHLVEDLLSIREQLESLNQQKNNTEENLKLSLIERGVEKLTLTKDGSPVVKWGKVDRVSVDTKRLKLEYPELAETLMTAKSYRQMRVL